MAEAYRIKDQQALYYCTITTIDWIDIFTKKIYKDILIDSMNYCIQSKGLEVYAFVIMSNHVHFIISTNKEPISAIIRDLKKFTAKQIIEKIQTEPESRKEWLLAKMTYAGNRNSNNTTYQLWQQDYHAIEIHSDHFLRQKTNYIHQNPVRAGIVEHEEDYLYSSARYFYNKKCLVQLSFVNS